MDAWVNGVFDNDTACDWATMLDTKRFCLEKTASQRAPPARSGYR